MLLLLLTVILSVIVLLRLIAGPGTSQPPGVDPSTAPWAGWPPLDLSASLPYLGSLVRTARLAKPFSTCTQAAREAGKVSLLASLKVGETPSVWARCWRPGSGAKVSSPGKGLAGPAEECEKVPAPSCT